MKASRLSAEKDAAFDGCAALAVSQKTQKTMCFICLLPSLEAVSWTCHDWPGVCNCLCCRMLQEWIQAVAGKIYRSMPTHDECSSIAALFKSCNGACWMQVFSNVFYAFQTRCSFGTLCVCHGICLTPHPSIKKGERQSVHGKWRGEQGLTRWGCNEMRGSRQ